MEDGGKSAAMAQQQLIQQQLMLQQIQRQKDAMSRFPSNIDAHLRPQLHHPPILHHRPLNPNSIIPNPNNNPNNPAPNNPPPPPQQQQQQQHHKASLQLAYQDAWRVCHPDFKRPFSSLEDACERLLPYHVVADYEAEEDDKILDSANNTTAAAGGQILSRSQQWDHNIAAKVAEFTATFEKQVLAFNIISRKRGVGEFRTEEKLMMEQFLLQEEKRSLLELRESRQKASRESHEANMRMAAMAHAESQAHAEMMARAPIRGSALGNDTEVMGGEDDVINGWGGSSSNNNNMQHKGGDDKEPSDDFLNDDETENGDGAIQGEWPGEGELDLNAR
ncbi:Unknown protein [Striga hermonthica]|uniref:GLTSCR protein conserved domain-containing protein n=1 Tax=Striga hermonthica TaxID=68872 RepID=A0A9N7N2C0_STRHE|nr:Unknown protein [Striga hermonthica]